MKKYFLFTLFLWAAISAFSLTEIDGFVFDDEAVVYYTGEPYLYNGFEIVVLNNTSYPYLHINDPSSGKNFGTYNWAFQYWEAQSSKFNASEFDIKGLFLSISLENSALNRWRPEKSVVARLKKLPVEELTVVSRDSGGLEEVPGYLSQHNYDAGYRLKSNLNHLGGYRISVEGGNPFIIFYDKDRPTHSVGVYNYERQYWVWHLEPFEPLRIPIGDIYEEIDLSKTDLNRLKPDYFTLWGNLDKEKTPYYNPDDKDFGDFISYLEESGVDQEKILEYRRDASNPAKRGALLPTGHFYEHAEQGFQPITLAPLSNRETRVLSSEMKAGGMQLYFEYHKGERFALKPGAPELFRNQIREGGPVEITLVQISSPKGHITDGLSGKALLEEVERFHEEKFGIDFKFRLKKVTADYSEFTAGPGEGIFNAMDRGLDKYVHSRFGINRLYMYYFTDAEQFAEVDRKLSHPRIWGAYAADWNRKKNTYLHELGHTLQLYHHFDEVKNESIREAHLSVPCIMNYHSFKAPYFCPLCTYSLGLPFREGVTEEKSSQRFFENKNGLVSLFLENPAGESILSGSYRFGKLVVQSMEWEDDFIVFQYYYPDGDSYLGRFSETMEFLGEYNFRNLALTYYKIFQNRVYAVYSNTQGEQFVGAFDEKMRFLGEYELSRVSVSDFKVDEKGISITYKGYSDAILIYRDEVFGGK